MIYDLTYINVPWSSRLLWNSKSRPNGKLIHNSILNVPYVRKMIPEPGDANREITVTETFHLQTDDELSDKELKQIKADDQAIQTILLGLLEDIYATEKKAKLFNEWKRFTSNERESIESYYHHFLKLMNDLKRNKHFLEKIASNLKFLNNLQPEWSRHVTIFHQTKDLHTCDYTQLYDFLKYNQKEVDELKAKRLAKSQDPLALMANSNNPYVFPAPHQDQPSFNQKYLQQPIPNSEDITDPTTAMNMALALTAKAFKLNYSTPTNNNQRISSNLRNRQITQPGQNVGNPAGYNDVIGHQIRNGNPVTARAEGNAAGQTGNQIRCYNCRGEEAGIQLQEEEYDLIAAATDLDEIKEVNANCILMANLQQASTSGNLRLLINFVWKFMGTVHFRNDHVAAILGFGDLKQFCDSDLEVAFRRDACFVKNLEGVDLLNGDRLINLYTINHHEMASVSPISLMARASSTKSWLWHQRLSHLNFDTINDLARNDLVSEAARTMLVFSCALLFLWDEAIATVCFTQNRSIIHCRFNKTPYELINSRKPDITFLYVFGALCYPKNDHEDIEKLGAKGDISFFIGLDLTYAPKTITMQQPTEGEVDLLFKAMYDDYIGGQPSATARTVPPAQEPQVRQSSTASTTIADITPIPINSSSLATNILITSQDVDELKPNAMVDGNTFVNPFVNSSTSAATSSSHQNVDPSNMHTFYQPYPYEFQWTKDHPLEQVIGEPSRPVVTRN
nr:integrase, catalytic region, zinc finger, CCHC-type, peptidase aspartic, catalytic [Tanacetum cinerariifolium]